ncbi:helix-turn-helix domain-containing protein [Psychrobacillus sp. L3]|uniref:helix-turn-helix domain-containing protein n=1 Tax=Psychrobacillus sp. L3 TaxID=3236891 RepID=UPI0036F417D1
MTTTLLNIESTYKSLQSFSSIEEMNASIKQFKQQFQSELTKSTKEVLELISQYACKFVGVCYLSKSKIASTLSVSYKTVQRSCKRLEELGIFIQHTTKRATGDKRQSSNAIVIQAYQVGEVECPTIMSDQEAFSKTIKSNNTDDTKKADSYELDSKESLIKQGLVNKLPLTLQYALAPFFKTDELYTLVGTIYKAKASIDRTIQLDDYEDEYRQSILSVINAFRRGKVKNLSGLLYHAIKSATKTIWIKQRVMAAYGI